MTSSYVGRSRRSNGSIVIRSVAIRWRWPEPSVIAPSRPTSVSNARGQSSSVPSSRPIRWVVSSELISRTAADDARVGRATTASRAPRRTPTGQARTGSPWTGAARRTGGVDSSAPVVSSHCPCPHTSSMLSRPRSQSRWSPSEVGDVVHRVVEVRGLTALAPPVPRGGVVVTGHADRQRKQVGALEREVGGVVRAEADTARDHLARATAVVADERNHLAQDPRFVDAMAARPLLERNRPGWTSSRGRRSPRSRASRRPSASRSADRGDHPVALELARVAALSRERDTGRAGPHFRTPPPRSPRRPHAGEQPGQVGMECVAPAGVVVQVGHLGQRRAVALRSRARPPSGGCCGCSPPRPRRSCRGHRPRGSRPRAARRGRMR